MKNNFNLSTLVRPNVAKLQPYSSARDEFTSHEEEKIFLDANENPFNSKVNRYPDPQQKELKAELAQQRGVEQSQILLGNGSDEVLDLIFRAFCEPKSDNIIILPPTYGMYKVLADINNIEGRAVLLDPDFEPQVEKIFAAVDNNSKIIFLCSPNNPTGNSLCERKVTEILKNFTGLVVIDEAYSDFSEAPSWIIKLQEYPNLLVTQTLSKAYGMAGIRLGIAYASREIISVLNKIKPPYNVSELTQQRALKGIRDKSKLKKEVSEILRQRSILTEGLKGIRFVQEIFPSDANFLLIRVDDGDKRYKEILERGVVVRNRSAQPLCENTLRISIGTPEENENLLSVMMECDELDERSNEVQSEEN